MWKMDLGRKQLLLTSLGFSIWPFDHWGDLCSLLKFPGFHPCSGSLILFFFFFIFKILKSLILTSVPKHEPPSHLPPHNISLGHPHAPAPSKLHPTSDMDWLFNSYMTVYNLTYSFPKLEPVCCSMSSSIGCFLSLLQIYQETGQVVSYSHLFQDFP